nr:MAG TPA: methyltransferase [Caudoviricetes sp.]
MTFRTETETISLRLVCLKESHRLLPCHRVFRLMRQ